MTKSEVKANNSAVEAKLAAKNLERAKRFGQETSETIEEKKEMRAARFELNSDEQKKLDRAKRFQLNTPDVVIPYLLPIFILNCKLFFIGE